MQSKPLLSAVVVAGGQRERAGRALRSILSQEGLEQAEIVLVDTSADQTPVPGSDHPAVRLVRANQKLTFGEARALGVEHARGNFVAFLEDHSLAFPGWLNAQIQAFRGSWAAVGPEIHNANPGLGISDAVWLMNYHPSWRPPARFGPSHGVPGHNSAYRRDVLIAFGDTLPKLLQIEMLLYWKLQDQGQTVGIDPAVKAGHVGETTLPHIIEGYYVLHRYFGHVRVRVQQWSVWTRLFRIAATPLVPGFRLFRFAVSALRNRPADLKIILRFFHVILLAQSAAALGMAIGYIFGPGQSASRFLEFETSEPRGELPGE